MTFKIGMMRPTIRLLAAISLWLPYSYVKMFPIRNRELSENRDAQY
jgi:hypothetical protein